MPAGPLIDIDFRALPIITQGAFGKTDLLYATDPPCIQLKINDSVFVSIGNHLYICLAKLREQMPDVDFLCKGSKLNLHSSRSTRQITAGLMAYELTMGKQARRSDLVNIFDCDDNNLTSKPDDQNSFFEAWLTSLE